jgi:hypothetical protein
MTNQVCPCGAVHELSAGTRATFENVTAGLPLTVVVEVSGVRWLVPRIFIAAHGLKAAELPTLAAMYGFKRDDR